ncbi:beta-lactamase class A [Loktanella ponticola]|uniref:beta-lactamase n=1 Tax=Yoonia ponticola TaxID=1524255 RepID=A0A7W9BNV3_9RHOB|nr:class A beta-lactamase [Yoonia ponticola]MBB5723933.1 beta-lactamase class A [Yoonia ponticola]
MSYKISRRETLSGLLSCVAGPIFAQEGGHGLRDWQPRTYDDGLIPNFSFEVIELSLRGAVGVFALDTETGRASGWGENIRVPLNSTFKVLLSAIVLRRIDAGIESLERKVAVQASDIVAWAPVLDHRIGQSMSIDELCNACMTLSDNAAANILLRTMGGPAGLTAALREIGDEVTRIDRYEPDLNNASDGVELDTTTPHQMVWNLNAFLRGSLLNSQHKALLLSWMVGNTTGGDRIRAGTPADWRVGDRTGTGPAGETSTVAVIYPPSRQPLIMAVYLRGSPHSPAKQSETHAELARIATTNVILPPYDPYAND